MCSYRISPSAAPSSVVPCTLSVVINPRRNLHSPNFQVSTSKMSNPIDTTTFHRIPQSKFIDSLRFLSPLSPFSRLLAVATTSTSATSSAAIEIHSLTAPNPGSVSPPTLSLQSSLPSPSRISSLRCPRSASPSASRLPLAFSTFSGSLLLAFLDPTDASLLDARPVEAPAIHRGPVTGLDVAEGGGGECVSVGMDGRVNVVCVGEGGRVECRRIGDSKGLVGYSAVRWGSTVEFATGGLGFGLQWWDQRQPGGIVSQFKGNWARGNMTGMVHSIDIHPSRKHICVMGGSSGTIFAWDLRWQQQPIMLSGPGLGGTGQSPSESEVWEVQYDSHTLSSSTSAPSAKVLPVMMCSEDGILVVLEQGNEPIELLAEPCAINAFDIDPQNPSDVVCALEWESIGILARPRMAMY